MSSTKDPRYQVGWTPPYGEDYDNWEHMKICNPDFVEKFGDIAADGFWEMTDALFGQTYKPHPDRRLSIGSN